MKVVIDIPEEDYDYLYVKKEVEGQDLDYYHQLILNGTPLPQKSEEPNDLAELDKVIEYLKKQRELCIEQTGCEPCLYDYMCALDCEEFQDLFFDVSIDWVLNYLIERA